MATLHKTTETIKKILKGALFLLGIILTGIIIFRGGGALKEYLFPTPPPPPTVAFGKLSYPAFPPNATDRKLTYALNTLSGRLPIFPNTMRVYKTQHKEPSLLALQKVQGKVSNIGFTSPGVRLSQALYQWNDTNPQRKLIFDIVSFNFDLSSDFLENKDVLKAHNLPKENETEVLAQSFLSAIYFPEDLDTAKTKTTLLSIENSKLIPATSFSKTHVVRVDFFQKNIDSFPVLYPNPSFSTMNVFLADGNYREKVVEAHFVHNSVGSVFATYPIKAADDALSEITKGKGYIASYFGDSNEVLIKEASLGYYLGNETQDYLVPIIFFEGNNGFFAYIPAVKDEWISK